MHVVFVYPGFENLGLEYLSAALELAGHHTSLAFDPALFDDAFLDVRPLAALLSAERAVVERIVASQPDLVAFGVMTPCFPWALALVRRLRRAIDVPVVFGGIHPTTVPERVLRHAEIDFVIRGEGEDALVELADALAAGRSVGDIANLAFRERPGGEVRINPMRPLVADLDTLPFPNKNLFLGQAELFGFGYSLMTERGCSYSCSFCHHYNGKKLYGVSNDRYVRRRSVANVLDELHQAVARFDPAMIRFEDETFTSNWPWVEEFCERYAREVGLPFFCLGRPDTIHEPMVKALVGAGCREIEIGVQSFDADVRRRIAYRTESDDQVRRALRLCRDGGLKLNVDVILNLPGETEANLLAALEYLVETPPAGVNAFCTSYYPGTAVLDIARAQGIVSSAEAESILDGETRQRQTQGGHAVSPSLARLGFVFWLIPNLPASLVRWLARHRRYRFLPYPGFTGALVTAALIGLASDRLKGGVRGKIRKFEAMRIPARYVTYLGRKLSPRFRAGRTAEPFRQPSTVRRRSSRPRVGMEVAAPPAHDVAAPVPV